MARKRTRRPAVPVAPVAVPETQRAAVTAERFVRLHRLLGLLAEAAQTRQTLARRLGIDVRGFYRDLELLRGVGIGVRLSASQYALEGTLTAAVALLPFPDPRLTLGEAMQLAKGRAAAHQRIKEQVDRLVS